ncbi:unnamed protein product [Linum trigynum]|uniref:Uncharacterized protein n=1 Tax=Linum trigynum TaxID=586398 RepID=A0AAV2D6M2_9ROSI
MNFEEGFLVSTADCTDTLMGTDHTVVKIPPVEARRWKLVLDDSGDELTSPMIPMQPMPGRPSGHEEKKKGKSLVMLGNDNLVADKKKKRPTSIFYNKTQLEASSSHP